MKDKSIEISEKLHPLKTVYKQVKAVALQKLELMKFEKIHNPIFDEPIIPTGLQTLDDLTAVEELENPLNDYEPPKQ